VCPRVLSARRRWSFNEAAHCIVEVQSFGIESFSSGMDNRCNRPRRTNGKIVYLPQALLIVVFSAFFTTQPKYFARASLLRIMIVVTILVNRVKHMRNQPSRLSLLRVKYQEAIRNKRAEIESLQQKIALIQEAEADATLDLFNAGNGRYSNLGIADAARTAINEMGETPQTTAQVRKHLLDNGYAPRGKSARNFTVSLAQTLMRLADHKNKKINTGLRAGKRVFWKSSPQYRPVPIFEREAAQ
jgi:hypothetical protein